MDNSEKKINPRKAIFAFLLSAIVPGLGQLYNGQLKKALIFSLGTLTYSLGINILGLKIHFWIYVIALAVLVILRLFIAIEATVTANKSKEYELKSYNKWYVYLLSIVIWYFTVSMFERIASETQYIISIVRSNSGFPTVVAGDYILGDYGFYNSQEPTYGDLVILSMPNGERYIYRIIGMPNDTLSIENQLVKYNDKELSSKLISTLFYEKYEMEEFVEILPNGVEYKFVRSKTPFFQENDTIEEIIVPNNSYFLLGDNRNFSFDSRFIGFVQREQIQGKLVSIYFSKDLKRINESL
ncbi:MAG: signal peptidase I [Dysgonamonadaceae bacterium]|nr:signal peptidase I [Dysgonamonadaceae bacterium]